MTSLIAVRGSKGIGFIHGPPSEGIFHGFERDESANCKDMSFTEDGKYFAWSNGQQVSVVTTTNFKPVCHIDKPRVAFLNFSSNGTFLVTWEPYSVAKNANPQENCNMHIWNVETGSCLKSFIQKKQYSWKPQWSSDESLCSRSVNNEVHFFEDGNFSTITKKIFMTKVASFSLSPGAPPYHVACYVPGVKGQPCFVRMFTYPKFDGASSIIAQKSFYKADRIEFFWNKTGKDLIAQTTVDVDKSGASYYGEQNLYYLSVKGDTARVALGKEGPIYSFQWSPSGTEFCALYGFMPARATMYNVKCEPVFDFGSGPRNDIIFSPLGDKLTLYGFGSLRGNLEVWDLKEKKMINTFTATDSTYISWSPDGDYILTATTTPRLRIGNGYRIWHYTGSLQQEVTLPGEDELYDLKWKPFPEGTFKVKATVYAPVPGIQSSQPEASKQVYRPPGARGQPSTFKIHDYEPPGQTVQPQNEVPNKVMTKNQKKNMAKKSKKEQEKINANQVINGADLLTPNPSIPTTENVQANVSENPERAKKIKAVLKKLDQIDKLKQDLLNGKKLELNQTEKIKKEDELKEELQRLQI